MLYVTTRLKSDTFTAAHALNEDRGPAGGFYAPMRLPVFTEAQIAQLAEKTLCENIAHIVNLLFGTRLDGWAVEFAIGRYPVKLVNAGNRTLVAETWHNPAWRFQRLARGVEKAIRQSDEICEQPTPWLMTGARVAVMFGIFGELSRSGLVSAASPIDVVAPTGDFSLAMACRYARKMGLPIHNILVCCNENSGAWNLIHKGQLRTDAPLIHTQTPDCDHRVPEGLERLIFETLGTEEAAVFLQTCRRGATYYLEPEQLQVLREGLYATVVSTRQLENAVTSLYGSFGYLADPYTALCVGGIGAYRSKSGESRTALVISEESPTHHLPLLAQCLGTTASQLKQVLG